MFPCFDLWETDTTVVTIFVVTKSLLLILLHVSHALRSTSWLSGCHVLEDGAWGWLLHMRTGVFAQANLHLWEFPGWPSRPFLCSPRGTVFRGIEGGSERATCTLLHHVKQLLLPYFCSALESQEQWAAWIWFVVHQPNLEIAPKWA